MVPEFGTPLHPCRTRPGAYGVVVRDGQILVVRGPSGRWHLPGGGLEPNETVDEALRREILEETGYVVASSERLGIANQYQVIENNEPVLKQCHFFAVELTGDPVATSGEEVAWVPTPAAVEAMAEEASAWAVRTHPHCGPP